jgi:hypothetical protein
VSLVAADPSAQPGLIADLAPAVVGVGDLDPIGPDLGHLGHELLSSFPDWGGDGGPAPD